VEELLNNPFVVTGDGNSGLILAIISKRLNIVQYLMKMALGIQNGLNGHRTSPLQFAVASRDAQIVEALLTPPTDSAILKETVKQLQTSYNDLPSPQEMAAKFGDAAILESISNFKRAYETKMEEVREVPAPIASTTAFLGRCAVGDTESVKKYVEENLDDPYVTDLEKNTAVIYAIKGQQAEMVCYLVKVAPGIQLLPNVHGTTALQVGVASENPRIVEALLAPPPETFPDAKLILQRTVSQLQESYNMLPSPEAIAVRSKQQEIIKLITMFKQENSRKD